MSYLSNRAILGLVVAVSAAGSLSSACGGGETGEENAVPERLKLDRREGTGDPTSCRTTYNMCDGSVRSVGCTTTDGVSSCECRIDGSVVKQFDSDTLCQLQRQDETDFIAEVKEKCAWEAELDLTGKLECGG